MDTCIKTENVLGRNVEEWDSHFFHDIPTMQLNDSYIDESKFKQRSGRESHGLDPSSWI